MREKKRWGLTPVGSVWVMVLAIFVACFGPVMFAQAANVVTGGAAGTSGTALTPGQTNEAVVAFIWAYVSSATLEWWKKSRFGVMTVDGEKNVKRFVAVLTSMAGALGVHSSFDAAAGTLTITGLLLPGISTALWDSIRQFVFQQFIYRSAIEEKQTW